jgi:hypothetical protein
MATMTSQPPGFANLASRFTTARYNFAFLGKSELRGSYERE